MRERSSLNYMRIFEKDSLSEKLRDGQLSYDEACTLQNKLRAELASSPQGSERAIDNIVKIEKLDQIKNAIKISRNFEKKRKRSLNF